MCGIIYARRPVGYPVRKVIKKRYEHQKARGKQGYGYIAVDKGYVKEVVRAKTEDEIMAKLKKETSNEILFHHRYPTSTDNHEGTTHPIVVSDPKLQYDYYIIHNGVIQNASELKARHESLGFVYRTYHEEITEEKKLVVFPESEEVVRNSKSRVSKFNDSEAFAIEMARYLEGQVDRIAVTGSISFMGYKTDKKGKILQFLYGHNGGNPLVVEYVNSKKAKKKNKDSSKMFVLKSLGQGVQVPEDVLHIVDFKSKKVEKIEVEIGSYASKMGYRSQSVYDSEDYGYGARPNRHDGEFFRAQGRLIEPPKRNTNTGKDDERSLNFSDGDMVGLDSELQDTFTEMAYNEISRKSDEVQEKMIEVQSELDSYKIELSKPYAKRGPNACSDHDLKMFIDQLMDEMKEYKEKWNELQVELNNFEMGYQVSPYQNI